MVLISLSVGGRAAVIAQELVPLRLSNGWKSMYCILRICRKPRYSNMEGYTDYVALGFVAMTGPSIQNIPSQPPASLTDQFRAVHKAALTGAVH